METPDFRPEQDASQEHKHMRNMRKRFLDETAEVFHRAQVEEISSGMIYTRREPLAVQGFEEVISIMLTPDGARPLTNKNKEHIMIYLPFIEEDIPEASMNETVWIKDCRELGGGEYEERRYVLTEKEGLQPEARNEDELREDTIAARGGQTEATQIWELKERLDQFMLTPFQGDSPNS